MLVQVPATCWGHVPRSEHPQVRTAGRDPFAPGGAHSSFPNSWLDPTLGTVALPLRACYTRHRSQVPARSIERGGHDETASIGHWWEWVCGRPGGRGGDYRRV